MRHCYPQDREFLAGLQRSEQAWYLLHCLKWNKPVDGLRKFIGMFPETWAPTLSSLSFPTFSFSISSNRGTLVSRNESDQGSMTFWEGAYTGLYSLHHFTYCRVEHIVPLFKHLFICLFVSVLITERGIEREGEEEKIDVKDTSIRMCPHMITMSHNFHFPLPFRCCDVEFIHLRFLGFILYSQDLFRAIIPQFQNAISTTFSCTSNL